MLRIVVKLKKARLWSEEISYCFDRRAYIKILCTLSLVFLLHYFTCMYVFWKKKTRPLSMDVLWLRYTFAMMKVVSLKQAPCQCFLLRSSERLFTMVGLDRQSLSHVHFTELLQHICGITNNYSTSSINERQEKSISIFDISIKYIYVFRLTYRS